MYSPADQDHVVVSVPARTEYLQLLRLIVAGIAGSSFTIAEIEDLKIAIEEFAALVIALPDSADCLEVRFELTTAGIVVTGERPWPMVGVLDAGEFLPTILDAVVDRHALVADETCARFVFEKSTRGR